MEKDVSFISYNEMLKQIEGQKNNYLLLGNGFNCSLGIKTKYSDIFKQMKIDNPN